MDIYRIIKEPHIAEKGSLQKELYNQITFKVDRMANKVEIKLTKLRRVDYTVERNVGR